jgi:hypothetical protein
MSGFGTSRHFAATQHFGRFRGEADIKPDWRFGERYFPDSILKFDIQPKFVGATPFDHLNHLGLFFA